MTPNKIASEVTTTTNYNENQFPLEQFWDLISKAHEEVYSNIASYIDKNYSFEMWKVEDAIEGQYEFTLLDYYEKEGTRFAGQDKIEKVFVKYNENVGYQACTPTTFEFVPDLDKLAKTQHQTNPLCIIADNSVFIFPSLPKDLVAGDDTEVGVKLYGSRKPYPLLPSMDKTAIFVPELYHSLIVLNAIARVWKKKRNYDEANQWQLEYQTKMIETLNQLQTKRTSTVIGRPLSHKEME